MSKGVNKWLTISLLVIVTIFTISVFVGSAQQFPVTASHSGVAVPTPTISTSTPIAIPISTATRPIQKNPSPSTGTEEPTRNRVPQTSNAGPVQKSVSPSPTYGTRTKTSNCIANQALPDPTCTPGEILTTDPNIVCVSGYTKTVRDVPLSLKERVFAEYGIDHSLHGNYEVDHLISLELGGSNDISNLWPEPHDITNGSFTKDKLENYLHSQVCSGVITMQQA